MILGVDPGTLFCGFSLVRKGPVLHHSGVLKLKRTDPMPMRIGQIYNFFQGLITEYEPSVIAMETMFLKYNPQSFLKLGYVRGILFLLSEQHGLELKEYAPSEIKRAIVGTGAATKADVAHALCKIFPALRNAVKTGVRSDITDAIAIACTPIFKG